MTNHFKIQGRSLLSNGYLIVPIRKGEKRPAIDSWQKARLGMGDLDRHPNHGVGVLCGQGANPVVGVDIDISHPTIGPALVDWCQQHLGYGGERIGAAPRIMLVYRASEAGWAKGNSVMFFDPTDPVKPNGKENKQQVEILGLGQQFVAYHEHPDTHRDYEWVDMMGGLEYQRADDLPTVTEAQIEALLAEVMRLVRATDGVEVTGRSESPQYQSSGDDDLMGLTARVGTPFAEITGLMGHLANDGDDYDTWTHVGMALHHEYAGTEHEAAALQAWRDYGAKSSKDDESQYAYKWTSFGKQSRHPVTLRWLLKRAHKAKRDFEARQSDAAKTEWIQALATTTDAVELKQAVCPKIANDSRLDDMDRDALAQSLMDAFKRLGTKYRIDSCRKLIAKPAGSIDDAPSTHHGYAKGMLSILKSEANGQGAIGADGVIYLVNAACLHVPVAVEKIAVRIAEQYDGGDRCCSRSDYQAIAAHSYIICQQDRYFDAAPIGLACTGGFYQIEADGAIIKHELTAEHRQRHMHATGPESGPMPLFRGLLEASLCTPYAGEDLQQIDQLQEIAGATALGLLAQYEKVALFFGPGRSGKGTMTKIFEAMVPPDSCVSVSPFRWDDAYYLANFAGKRLNTVGELPEDTPIPAANFKSITGRDSLTGRHPYGMPFQFRNEAAHIFSSNTYPNTRDHSEAFYTRWLIVSFPNSRIDGTSIETDLAARIIANEMPAILAWALEGAQRLIQRGRFEVTSAHSRHMARWQVRTDSIMEFLHDEDTCTLDTGRQCKRTSLYDAYTRWCGPAGRKPMRKQKFNDSISSPTVAILGITVKRDPVLREVVQGVCLYDGNDGLPHGELFG